MVGWAVFRQSPASLGKSWFEKKKIARAPQLERLTDLEIEFCWNFVSPSILCSKKKKDPGSTLGVTLHGLIQGEIDLSRNYIQTFEASRNL